jgi:MSHA pilin protein MshA
MKKQGGFTLIELVVVIVILGILAITAAPRFLNLQDDARASALQGMKGAMLSAGSMVYGKAAIEGVEREDYNTDTAELADGTELQFGYPRATAGGIVAVVQGLADTSEWTYKEHEDKEKLFVTFANNNLTDFNKIKETECYVSYKEAVDESSEPTIKVFSDGC